jgi:hypothetical protein
MEADGDDALSRSEDDRGDRGSPSDAFTSGCTVIGSRKDASVVAIVKDISVSGEGGRFRVSSP